MSTESVHAKNPQQSSAAEHKPAGPPYLPPAIAWEEPFQVTVAASCALFALLDESCLSQTNN